MNSKSLRISISLAIYLAWIVITMFGARLIIGGEADLHELVSTGLGWHFAVAILLLLAAIIVFKWNDMQFAKPHSLVRVMWFPAIYLLLFLTAVILQGFPPLIVVFYVAMNTFMVGVSEELMFRGVLFRAFEKAMSIWSAIILTSILFGAVHILNVFITGELVPAMLQSVAATMSGFVFIAIVLLTGSIWPAILYHFFWDCLLFLAGSGAATTTTAANETESFAIFIPILLNLPNLIFALVMLRNNIGKNEK